MDKILVKNNLFWPKQIDLLESMDSLIRLKSFQDFDLNQVLYKIKFVITNI